jgi:hypothetical protein
MRSVLAENVDENLCEFLLLSPRSDQIFEKYVTNKRLKKVFFQLDVKR